eukprot:COSAG02_NODE_1577_length_11862_cov_13.243135_6_plen_82_part_00
MRAGGSYVGSRFGLAHVIRVSFGLIIRFTSANFRVFFVLPIAGCQFRSLKSTSRRHHCPLLALSSSPAAVVRHLQSTPDLR